MEVGSSGTRKGAGQFVRCRRPRCSRGSTRTFASLTYVGDAARHPLRQNISNEEFIRTYGLAKTLCFQAATERAATDHDYWGELY